MKYLIIIFFSLLSFVALCQDDIIENEIVKEKNHYGSITFDFNINGKFKNHINKGAGVRLAVGYKINRWVNAGGGTGLEFYNFENKTIFIPIYIDVRGELTDWKNTPFYNLETGMGFRYKTDTDYWGNIARGFYFRPQLGWKFKRKNDSATTLGLGYMLQKSHEKYNNWGGGDFRETRIRTFQRYVFLLGFEF